MITSDKVEYVGELIRQLRRQKNMTQSELGANRYSKSYVSAVEKNAIRPSIAALHFFAEQLDQKSDYFTTMFENTKSIEQGSTLPGPLEIGNYFLHDDSFSLLSLLMQQADPLSLQNLKGLPLLSNEALAGFPPSRQCYYFLLSGLTALASREYETALQALEQALPLAPPQLRPQVIDAIGQYYSLTSQPAVALHYHLRALDALKQANAGEDLNSLLFVIALHCAQDCQALGDYEQACTLYEQARKQLRPDHMMERAALLYLGLGYCTYGLAFQNSLNPGATKKALEGAMEQAFQQAASYLMQSRSIYQVSRDYKGEAATLLIQTMALLDFITRYRQLATPISASFAASSLTFLNNAQELCRQILMRWESAPIKEDDTDHKAATIYATLGQLLQISIQRATLMRLRGQVSNALNERTTAAHLCQQLLNTIAEPVLTPTIVQQILDQHPAEMMPDSPSLPHLPELHLDTTVFSPHFSGLIEIYCAAGEVAEELGRTATTSSFRHDCYFQADECFHMALALAKTTTSAREHDPGYLLRHNHRYASLLEERLVASPEDCQETCSKVAALLKDGFSQITMMNK